MCCDSPPRGDSRGAPQGPVLGTGSLWEVPDLLWASNPAWGSREHSSPCSVS